MVLETAGLERHGRVVDTLFPRTQTGETPEEVAQEVSLPRVVEGLREDGARPVPSGRTHFGTVDEEEEHGSAVLVAKGLGDILSELSTYVDAGLCVRIALLDIVVRVELSATGLEFE